MLGKDLLREEGLILETDFYSKKKSFEKRLLLRGKSYYEKRLLLIKRRKSYLEKMLVLREESLILKRDFYEELKVLF